jgi:hypothetical protein
VLVDRVTALKAIAIEEEVGVTAKIENHEVTGGRRIVTTQSGPQEFKAGVPGVHSLEGRWADVEGRLGIVARGQGAFRYITEERYNRPGAREDVLSGIWRSDRREVNAGEIVARRVGIVTAGLSAEQVAAIDESVSIDQDAAETTVRFTGPDGRQHSVSLNENGRVLANGRALYARPAREN